MRPPVALIALALCSGTSPAREPDRPRVQDIRLLMTEAIDSASGESRGVLDGEVAQAIGTRFRTGSPILVDVTTERRYPQPGCSRLKVRFRQDGVLLPGSTAPQARSIDFGVDYCRDGSAPVSTR